MMNDQLEKDLLRCLDLISADWKMQNNYLDRRTNFIYSTTTLDDCLRKIDELGVDKEYTLHRWYNYMTSIKCEYLFCEYGAIHDEDIYNHDVDIYIDGVPFDVKVTIYPAKLSHRPYDLRTREGKDAMIRWYYTNQSQQSRKQLINRLYVVCDGETPYECLKMKSDFNLLRQRIGAFMRYASINGVNRLTIVDKGISYSVSSEIIYIMYKER